MTCVSSRAPLLAFKLKEVGAPWFWLPCVAASARPGAVPNRPATEGRSGSPQRFGASAAFVRGTSPRARTPSHGWLQPTGVRVHQARQLTGVRTGVSGAQARPAKNTVASSCASMKMIRPSFQIFHSAVVSIAEWIQQDWQVFHGNRRSSDPRHHRHLVRHGAVPWCRLRSMCA